MYFIRAYASKGGLMKLIVLGGISWLVGKLPMFALSENVINAEPLTMLALLGIGAGFGLLKRAVVDKPREDRERQLAALRTSLSPFTGRAGVPPKEGSAFGEILKFAPTALALGQNVKEAEFAQKLQDVQLQEAQNRALQQSIIQPLGPFNALSQQRFNQRGPTLGFGGTFQ